MAEDDLLTIESIDTHYGDSHVLFDVSLTVGRGEIVALVGRNGAGKTTTLRSVMCLTPVTSGRIEKDGEPIHDLAPHQVRKRGVSWVPEERRVFGDLTVEENLRLAAHSADSDQRERIATVYERFPRLDEVGCLVLYGKPEFSAGADLDAIERTPQEMRPAKIDTIAAASNRFIRAIRERPAPVIAAVSGVAAGGGLGFALASDLIVMHAEAVLDTAYARIGLTPDNATPFFLVNTVGPYKARELLFDPKPITAGEAVDLGLTNDVVHESAFIDAVTDRAATFAAGPTEVYAKTKRLVDTTFARSLDQHLEQERVAIKEMSDSDEFDEGLSAFLDEREPKWE